MQQSIDTSEPTRPLARACTIAMGVFVTLAALKIGAHVFVPLVLALFLIAIAWPLKTWVDHYLPRSLSYIGSIFSLTIVFALVLGIIWLSMVEVAQQAPAYQEAWKNFLAQTKQELWRKGVATHNTISIDDLRMIFMGVFQNFSEGAVIMCITFSYVLLAIPEVSIWRKKMQYCLNSEHSDAILKTSSEIVDTYQKYLACVVASGAINAAGTFLIAKLFHLDFPITWAVIIFLLNFLPTLGSSIIPVLMAALAFIQFDASSYAPWLVLAASGALQLVIACVIEPKIYADSFQLSPVVVLFSLTFWGFLWGVPGMLLSSPLTMALVITLGHYPHTRWIACMLSSDVKKYQVARIDTAFIESIGTRIDN